MMLLGVERSPSWRYLGLCWRLFILGGEAAVELGFARPKFGVCVSEQVVVAHLESFLPVRLSVISVSSFITCQHRFHRAVSRVRKREGSDRLVKILTGSEGCAGRLCR
jgi:hypothetical protein